MATAKKSAAKIKKPARKIAKKVPVAQLAAEAAAKAAQAPEAAPVPAKRGRGRPPGSKSNKAAKRSAGRPAATSFLYSLSKPAPEDDGLGLADTPKKVEVIGPFPSEAAAIEDAMASIGTASDTVVTLYRDYRTGTVEVKTRLV